MWLISLGPVNKGKSNKDTAAIMGISEGKLRKKIRSGWKKLIDRMIPIVCDGY